MNILLLNAENRLLVEENGRIFPNGYLTRLSLRAGELLRLTDRASGKTYAFRAELDFFLRPTPPFSAWVGRDAVYLLLREEPPFFPFFGGAGVRAEERTAPFDPCNPSGGRRTDALRLPGGERVPLLGAFPYAASATAGGCTLFRLTETAQSRLPTKGEGLCQLVVRKEEGGVTFCGVCRNYEVDERRGTLTVCTRLKDHRAHEITAVRDLKSGKILRQDCRATRHVDLTKLPEPLLPAAFLEEVFAGGDTEDFLCRALKPRAAALSRFLGNFCRVAFDGAFDQPLLLYGNGKTARLHVTQKEGAIFRVVLGE